MEKPPSKPPSFMSDVAGTMHEAPEKRVLRYRSGELIIKEGDFGIAIYRILSGAVSVFKESRDENVLIYELGPGDVFGEMVFIDGGQSPRTASVQAQDNVELEAWHYLSIWNEYTSTHPIIRLLALDMVKKLQKISAVHDRLHIEKKPRAQQLEIQQPQKQQPGKPDVTELRINVKEPTFKLKLAGEDETGKEWEGMVEYKLPENHEAGVLKATGVDIDEDGVRIDVSLANMNQGGHEPGSKIDLFLHLPGSNLPVRVSGEITSISRGALMGHTALRVRFHDVTPDEKMRIRDFINT